MNLKALGLAALVASAAYAAPDPNFHIYIAFGQSNMEGQGNIEQQDKTVDKRFQMMATVDNCSGRKLGTWNDAVPPLANCSGKLGPTDYFGRTMVEKTDEQIKVGVIVVAVAGCSIKLFQENLDQGYMSQQANWFMDRVRSYGGNPYTRMIEMAKKAQQDGVIKGIIFHQGETDAGDGNWPSAVKKVYDNILKDLGLGDDIPFLAGEVLRSGTSSGANNNIAKLPQQSKNFYVISSEGFNQALGDGQNVHFTSQEYRDFGKRYAEKMIEVLGDKLKPVAGSSSDPAPASSAAETPASSATATPASSATTAPASSSSSGNGFNWGNGNGFDWGNGNGFDWGNFGNNQNNDGKNNGDQNNGDKNGESNIGAPATDSTTAIAGSVVAVKSASFNVFDMQGRYLGFVKLTRDSHVADVIKARFHKSGIYLIKRGNFTKRVAVK